MSFQEEFNKFAESALLEDEGKILPLIFLSISLGFTSALARYLFSFFDKKVI